MAVWLGIPAARRFRQVGGTCVAICVEYALLRSHACMPLEIIAFLRVPGGLSIFSAVQAAYSAANADLSVLRTCSAEDMLLLRARNIQQAIAKLSQFADRQAQDGETLPARSARQFNVTVCALLTVDLSIRGFCSMSGIVPVAPGVMQPAWQPRDAKGLLRLQRDYIEPGDRRWIRILEDALRVAGGGGASVLLVGLEGWANHRAHLIVVDLFSACPGVFDPNLGFIALPEREWISDYLLWLLCLLAVYYRSDHLWVGRVSYSGPMNEMPVRWHAAASRTRTVRRPARK